MRKKLVKHVWKGLREEVRKEILYSGVVRWWGEGMAVEFKKRGREGGREGGGEEEGRKKRRVVREIERKGEGQLPVWKDVRLEKKKGRKKRREEE